MTEHLAGGDPAGAEPDRDTAAIEAGTRFQRVVRGLFAPVDGASLAMFRVLFGLMMFAGLTRFAQSGWIDRLYVEPSFFFKYHGFSWVRVWPAWGLYLHFGLLAALALCVAAGLFYRLAIVLFFLGFTYVQLMDVTNYLNHYYLVVLLSGLMCLLPMRGAWSIDGWRKPSLRRVTVPAWAVNLLRFQIAVVYVNAGLAKVGSDWLLHAQPMNIWMTARNETPVIGPLLDERWVAGAMSWAGCLYDSLIVVFLLMARTRPFAYAMVLLFHGLTGVFFDIGMFPVIMVTSTLIFFPPDWPRRFVARIRSLFGGPRAARTPASAPAPAASSQEPRVPARGQVRHLHGAARPLERSRRLGLAVLAAYALFQVLFPLRHLLYPGDVLWNEEGMRFAWKVMVREKSGSITYHVRSPGTGRSWQVSPTRYLTWRQANEMSGQPDLILQLARHVAAEFRRRGLGDVEVRAEARVSLNGRRPELMIDPDIDLAKVEDGLRSAAWIRPMPDEPPIHLTGALAGWRERR